MTASKDYHFDQDSQVTDNLAAELCALERRVTVGDWTPHLSAPSPAFLALPGSLKRVYARIDRHYRKLEKIGQRIAMGCPRVNDERDIDAINRKLDMLGDHLSTWDHVIEDQARTWHAEKLGGFVGRRRALVPVRQGARRRCGRTRLRTPRRRRRCTASRARSTGDDGDGDGDGDEPTPEERSGAGRIGGAR